MVDPTVLALASSGATALVTAAGTDAWTGLRAALARWVGRGDPEREGEATHRLGETEIALRSAAPEELERVRLQEEAVWRDRFRTAFRALEEAERDRAADELREVLGIAGSSGGMAVGPGGLTAGRDAIVRADNGVAIGVVSGGQTYFGTPLPPDPHQG
ncbi:hypothetical protein [Streptomyces eurythermus]|uniref:hypothetical protein n=1 Tax=Streptomyces eurythermus TaxID=42237 RepID=UPI0036F9285C